MTTSAICKTAILVLILLNGALAQDNAMFAVEFEDLDRDGIKIDLSLPLSLLATFPQRSAELSEFLNETESRCDEIRTLWQGMGSGRDETLADFKTDAGNYVLRKQGDILEFEMVEAARTTKGRIPLELFDAMFLSHPGCRFTVTESAFANLKAPFVLLIEERISGKVVKRGRIWIDRDGQEPPPWL